MKQGFGKKQRGRVGKKTVVRAKKPENDATLPPTAHAPEATFTVVGDPDAFHRAIHYLAAPSDKQSSEIT